MEIVHACLNWWFCGGGFFFYLTLRRLCKCLLKWPCEIIGVYEQANGAFFIVVHWHLIQAMAVSLKTFVESQFGIMRPITLITFLCVVLSLQLALSHGCYSSFRCIRIWCCSVASSFGLILPHSLGKSPYTNRPIFPSQGCWHTLKVWDFNILSRASIGLTISVMKENHLISF